MTIGSELSAPPGSSTGIATAVADRRSFAHRLATLLQPTGGSGAFALFFLDLDRFHLVNQRLGFEGGDQVLEKVASRLSRLASGQANDAVSTPRIRPGPWALEAAHFGGDKFLLIARDCRDRDAAGRIAQWLVDTFAAPFHVGTIEVHLTCRIGVSLAPDDATTADQLMAAAEQALRRAKLTLTRSSWLHSSNQSATLRHVAIELEAELRRALDNNEFFVQYQPKLSCATGAIVGAEALLRWRHPSRGIVPPALFLEELEDSGLVVPVGEWVLETACRELSEPLSSHRGAFTLAVNISGHQLKSSALPERVSRLLSEGQFPAQRLELELTERVVLDNSCSVAQALAALKALGIRLAIDDFGTGYSSLCYLSRLPVDALKIDRSFVHGIEYNAGNLSIVRAVISMARSLGLESIAEGVETEGQLGLLIANDCDSVQGFYFSAAVDAAELIGLLADDRRLRSRYIDDRTSRRTLLVVDDDANVRNALRRVLRKSPFEIIFAASGEEGLKILAEHKIDVVLADQRMPHMTGVEFLQRVKAIHPHTVRLVLSGYTDLGSVTDAINQGAIYKYLNKPWEDPLLIANLDEAFRHKEMLDRNRALLSDLPNQVAVGSA